MPVSPQELATANLKPMEDALIAEGITLEELAKKLKLELVACETKASCAWGKWKYSKRLIDWKTRQAARVDAQKLLSAYPAEKLNLTHDLTEHTKKLLDTIDGQSRNTLPGEEED